MGDGWGDRHSVEAVSESKKTPFRSPFRGSTALKLLTGSFLNPRLCMSLGNPIDGF